MAVVVIVRVDQEGAGVGDALVAHTQEMAVDIVWLVAVVEMNIYKKAVDGRRAQVVEEDSVQQWVVSNYGREVANTMAVEESRKKEVVMDYNRSH